jgi:hypothetical protein
MSYVSIGKEIEKAKVLTEGGGFSLQYGSGKSLGRAVGGSLSNNRAMNPSISA